MAQVSIFVSHSHQDNEWCRPLVAALKAVGYDVWYDETGLAGGDAWVVSIQREVQARDVFLLILTPDAWTSPWVQDELQLAIATRRRIIPVLLRNTQVDGFILTTQWVTVVGEEPQVAARSVILAIETPPAPGRGAVLQAPTETLDDLLTLCQSLQAEGRYTEALSACDRALALDQESISALCLQGVLLDRIGQKTRAATAFARMLSLMNAKLASLDQAAQRDVTNLSDYLYRSPDYLTHSSLLIKSAQWAEQNATIHAIRAFNLYVGLNADDPATREQVSRDVSELCARLGRSET